MSQLGGISNYLSNSAKALQNFGSEFGTYLQEGLNIGRGASGPRAVYGGIGKAVDYAKQGNIPLAAATGTLDVLTDSSSTAEEVVREFLKKKIRLVVLLLVHLQRQFFVTLLVGVVILFLIKHLKKSALMLLIPRIKNTCNINI